MKMKRGDERQVNTDWAVNNVRKGGRTKETREQRTQFRRRKSLERKSKYGGRREKRREEEMTKDKSGNRK